MTSPYDLPHGPSQAELYDHDVASPRRPYAPQAYLRDSSSRSPIAPGVSPVTLSPASSHARTPHSPSITNSSHERTHSQASVNSILPAAHPFAQYHYGQPRKRPPASPEFDAPIRGGRTRSHHPPRGHESRSVYSDDGNASDSTGPAELPGSSRSSRQRKSSNPLPIRSPAMGRPRRSSTAYGSDNPFMDSVREEDLPDMLIDDGSSYITSRASSGQFDLYVPDRRRAQSSAYGTSKSYDSIVRELEHVDDDDREDSGEEEERHINRSMMRQASLGRRTTGATIKSIRSNKPGQRPPPMPELDGRVISRLGQTSPTAGASSTALPSMAPLSPRSPYGTQKDSDAVEASRALGSRESSISRHNAPSRARSPLVPMQHYPSSGEQTPPKQGHMMAPGGKLFLMPERESSILDYTSENGTLDMEHPRQAEMHGSMTSLPGLITRAMNMAQNLEHGKTPNSRGASAGNDLLRDLAQRGQSTASFGQVLDQRAFSPSGSQKEYGMIREGSMTDVASESEFSRRSLAERFNQQRSSKNVRDMAFPLDSEGKPYSKYDHRNGSPYKPPRKCCGIPLWLFITLIVVAVVLVALAVALPVILVSKNSNAPSQPSNTCPIKTPCKNGGFSVAGPAGACQCMCVGTWSGPDCSTQNPSGCGNVQTSTVSNATVGQDLVSLFNKAQAQFNIGLNSSAILPIFNDNSLTCDMQNALITVTEKTKRDHRAALAIAATQTTDALTAGTTAPAVLADAFDLKLRDANAQSGVATVNGLIVAGGDGSATSTASAPTSSASAAPFTAKDPNVIAFAQTAILYVVQSSNNLGVAIGAQAQLQRFFGGSSQDPQNVDLGNGYTANLQKMSIKGNGSTVGKTTS